MDLISGLWTSLPSLPRTLIAFAVVIGVLVFVHEMGHYLAARWRGVRVDAFAIGFGRSLVRWTDRHGTEWRLGWIPLGGYVKLHGQEQPADVSPEVRASWRPGETFHEKSVASRAIVVAAGPIANFLLAILLFAALFVAIGRPMGTATIAAVVENSAAARSGLRAGDEIIALDGQPVARFEQVQRYVQPRAGQPIELRLLRDNAEITRVVTPEPRDPSVEIAKRVGVLGVQSGPARFERLDPISAIWAGAVMTVDVSWQTLVGIGEMFTGSRSATELGGPIRIAEISGQAADLGIYPLINLMAVLSISLGLLNLFPVPILDGGHLVFYAVEAVRGRPLPPRAQEYAFRGGFALLITLFLYASWNDIAQGGIGRWVSGLFG